MWSEISHDIWPPEYWYQTWDVTCQPRMHNSSPCSHKNNAMLCMAFMAEYSVWYHSLCIQNYGKDSMLCRVFMSIQIVMINGSPNYHRWNYKTDLCVILHQSVTPEFYSLVFSTLKFWCLEKDECLCRFRLNSRRWLIIHVC